MDQVFDVSRLAETSKKLEALLEKSEGYISGVNQEMKKLTESFDDTSLSKKVEAYLNGVNAFIADHQELLGTLKDIPQEMERTRTETSGLMEALQKELKASEETVSSQIEELRKIRGVLQTQTKTKNTDLNDIQGTAGGANMDARLNSPISPLFVAVGGSTLDSRYLQTTEADYQLLRQEYENSFVAANSVHPEDKQAFFRCVEQAFFGDDMGAGFRYYQTQAFQRLLCKLMFSNPEDLRRFLTEVLQEPETDTTKLAADEDDIPF